MRRIKISVPEEMYAALVREATLADRPVATMARILLGQRLRADVPLTHGFGGPEVGRVKVVVEDGGVTVEGRIDDPAMAAALAPDLRGVSVDPDPTPSDLQVAPELEDQSEGRVKIEDGKVVVGPPPLRDPADGHRHRYTHVLESTREVRNGVEWAMLRCKECPLTAGPRKVKS